MKGKVNRRFEAVLSLRVQGRGAARRTLAVIDTGYTGNLTLPIRFIKALKLPRVGESRAVLGDGSLVTFDVYAGKLLWHSTYLTIRIDAAETTPLIGMSLLAGNDVAMRVRRDGAVSVNRI